MQDKPETSTPRTLRLNARDNIIVAVDPRQPGHAPMRRRNGHGAHPCADTRWRLQAIAKGQPILKFGQIIGFASEDIAPGSHVHTHNCSFAEFERDYAFAQDAREEPIARRPNGGPPSRASAAATARPARATTSASLTSVNCSASVARFMAEAVSRSGILAAVPQRRRRRLVRARHGLRPRRPRARATMSLERTQWGYAGHPNLAAALVVGLGCEVFQIARLKSKLRPGRGRQLPHHDHPGHRRHQEDHRGRRRPHQGDAAARQCRAPPRPMPASELTLALQCGGSDGYSGITANPGARRRRRLCWCATAAPRCSPETPRDLWRRAPADAARRATARSARSWSTSSAGGRPTAPRTTARWTTTRAPATRPGGLTTILEKSLGAAAKGGTTTLNEVYRYAEPVTAKGFVYMDTPGYDPVAATGQVAGGCNVLCFTTGRGSAYGCKPTPSIKLATNHDIYRRMLDDMDINCGDILDGVSIEAKGQEIFDAILRVASGEKTKSELLGLRRQRIRTLANWRHHVRRRGSAWALPSALLAGDARFDGRPNERGDVRPAEGLAPGGSRSAK